MRDAPTLGANWKPKDFPATDAEIGESPNIPGREQLRKMQRGRGMHDDNNIRQVCACVDVGLQQRLQIRRDRRFGVPVLVTCVAPLVIVEANKAARAAPSEDVGPRIPGKFYKTEGESGGR